MLPFVIDLLGLVHAIGVALGAVGITIAETMYTKAVVDGKIDAGERGHLRHVLWSLHWGVMIVVVSAVALIIVEYFLPFSPQTVLEATFWMGHTLTVIVIVTGFMLSRNLIPWWLGSSAAVAAWWLMLALDVWKDIPVSFLALLLLYTVLVLIFAGIFNCVRAILLDREHRSRHHA